AVPLGYPIALEAFRAGIPDNGNTFPDGAKMAKVHYNSTGQEFFPDTAVPSTQHDVDFMVKDSRRFADGGGWGYAVFKHDASANTFSPGTLDDVPPQGNDAKCGVACHTVVENRDFVFTRYAKR
ncbi:cytochrome P460 family protein, partial [Salinarimonas soli]